MSAELKFLLAYIERLKKEEADLLNQVTEINRVTRKKVEQVHSLMVKVTKIKRMQVDMSKQSLEEDQVKPGPQLDVVREEMRGGNQQPLGVREGQGDDDQSAVRRDAVSIFPEEVWRKIFKMLPDSSDFWNLCNTCQLFEDILHSWKTGMMLTEALPFLYQHLPKAHLLKCRAVSRSWNGAVDGFLESHPSMRPYEDENGKKDQRRLEHVCPLKEKELFNCNCFYFCRDQRDNSYVFDQDRFPVKIGRCPFLGRYVGVSLGREESFGQLDKPTDQWWQTLDIFLEAFGKEIWYFTLVLPTAFNKSLTEKIEELLNSKLFQAMPNLRSLTLDFSHHRLDGENLQFPPHGKLESLRMVNFPWIVNSTLAKMVAAYGSQLKKLNVDRDEWSLICDARMDNLNELCLELGNSYFTVIQELHSLTPGRIPNLTKLQLVFPRRPRKCFFEDLLKFLARFSEGTNLKVLRIAGNIQLLQFESRENVQQCSIPDAEPSQLKTLELDIDWIECERKQHRNFNFIVKCFPKLENLIIFARKSNVEDLPDLGSDVDILPMEYCKRWARYYMDNQDEYVQIHAYIFKGKDMYKSNVWELLPHLKVLNIQMEVFTRTEYEAYYNKKSQVAE